MDNRVSDIIMKLREIAELLYQENIQDAYRNLALVIPQLDEILNDVNDEERRRELTEKLINALDAMENEDYTFLADTIQYELVEVLNDIDV